MGELLSAEIMAGLLARDSSSRRLPGLPTSDIMPFVLAYSGGSAGEWLHWSSTPLPYQALAGTMFCYSIVTQQAVNSTVAEIPCHLHPVKDDCRCESASFSYIADGTGSAFEHKADYKRKPQCQPTSNYPRNAGAELAAFIFLGYRIGVRSFFK